MKRYNTRRGMSVGDGDMSIRRIQGFVIIALALALAVSLILLLPGAGTRGTAHRWFTAQMLEECENAVQQASKLSRTASSYSYNVLAAVRSEVYAIDTLNRSAQEISDGRLLIPQDRFSAIYAVLDNYTDRLIKGTQTGDQQTELSGDLNELHLLIEALQ